MTSFIHKLRTITLGSVHDLLDKAIDTNSPSALRQYARDLEDALDRMKNEAAVQGGTVRTLAREKAELEVKYAATTTKITKILGGSDQNKNELARAEGAIAVQTKRQIESIAIDLEKQKEASTNLDLAVTKLDSKKTEMVSKIRELERLDRTTKAKESSAEAIAAAGGLMDNGGDISIDSIEQKMRARGDVADEKFDRAMGSVHQDENPDTAADVDELLASLTKSSPAA